MAGAGDPRAVPSDGAILIDASRCVPDSGTAGAIMDVTRDLKRSMPQPRGAPYFGLDSEVPYDLSVLDAFFGRGIFRKYELALELGSGLGGRARWLAARSGCRVVGIDPRAHTVAAAALLNRRARMDDQVVFCAGRLDCLPLRQRVFTHVWIVGSAYQMAAPRVFADAFHVLRPGGDFALQDVLMPRARREALTETLRDIGFVELEIRESPLSDPPHALRVVRDRLRVVLGDADSESAAPHESACVQVFGRRPA